MAETITKTVYGSGDKSVNEVIKDPFKLDAFQCFVPHRGWKTGNPAQTDLVLKVQDGT